MIFESYINEIGTYGAYHNECIKGNNFIVFQYINMILTPVHPLNLSNKMRFLDFGYLVLFNPLILKENGTLYHEYDEHSIFHNPNVTVLGGLDIQKGEDTEFIIEFSSGFLQVENGFNLSDEPIFIPWSRGILKATMSQQKVDAFFNKENLPLNIKNF